MVFEEYLNGIMSLLQIFYFVNFITNLFSDLFYRYSIFADMISCFLLILVFIQTLCFLPVTYTVYKSSHHIPITLLSHTFMTPPVILQEAK